jgi:hypothetical protein
MPSPIPIAPPVTIAVRPERSMSCRNGVACGAAVVVAMPGGCRVRGEQIYVNGRRPGAEDYSSSACARTLGPRTSRSVPSMLAIRMQTSSGRHQVLPSLGRSGHPSSHQDVRASIRRQHAAAYGFPTPVRRRCRVEIRTKHGCASHRSRESIEYTSQSLSRELVCARQRRSREPTGGCTVSLLVRPE